MKIFERVWDWLCLTYIYHREVMLAKMEDQIQAWQDSQKEASSQ